MKTIDKKYFKNPEKYIPKGFYCYNITCCPFWDMDKNKPEQENGYCHYLKRGDWDINPEIYEGAIFCYGKGVKEDIEGLPLSLLWDQVKECGVNDYTDEELEEMNT